MTATLECPRCRGRMEAGFVVDRQHHGQPGTQSWFEGTPQRSFWTGVRTKGLETYPVTTHRCPRCGYLESYALPE